MLNYTLFNRMTTDEPVYQTSTDLENKLLYGVINIFCFWADTYINYLVCCILIINSFYLSHLFVIKRFRFALKIYIISWLPRLLFTTISSTKYQDDKIGLNIWNSWELSYYLYFTINWRNNNNKNKLMCNWITMSFGFFLSIVMFLSKCKIRRILLVQILLNWTNHVHMYLRVKRMINKCILETCIVGMKLRIHTTYHRC